MTKISNQYSLTNILTADLANSRLGINNVSPAYSLDLTGTARVSTSAYFATASGSVGIGTTSPSDKLNIVVGANGNVARFDGPTSGLIFQTNASTTDIISYGGSTPAYRALNFSTGATTNLTITTAGNVGIGTTAPSSLLHIVSSVTTTTTIGLKDARIILQNNTFTGGAGGEVVLGAIADTNIGRYASIGTSMQSNGGGGASGDVYIATKSVYTDTSLTPRLYIERTGNVGIGTSSPARLLDVSNTSGDSTIAITSADTTGQSSLFFAKTSDGNIGGVLYTHSDNSMVFRVNDAERMRITSAGNVGIGTTTPSARLHTEIAVESPATGAVALIAKTSNGANDIFRWFDGATQLGVFKNSGNVGIGTSSINSEKLTVNQTTGNASALLVNTSGVTAGQSYGLTIQAGTNSSDRSFLVANQGGGTNYLLIRGDGNVNINGSGFSDVKFYVKGSDATSSNYAALFVNGSGTNLFNIRNDGAVTVFGSLSKGSGSFRIDHPLKPDTHQLVHSFIEGPQADLIYRGKLTLVNGKAQANIDEVSTMTEGTFEALCRDIQCFTTNENGWDLVKGKVIGNIIYIESQNPNSTDEISWMVIGERKDKHMMDTDWTDEQGKVIVEPLKQK